MLLTVNGDTEQALESEIRALKRYGVDGFLYSAMSNRVMTAPKSLAKFPLVLVDAAEEIRRFRPSNRTSSALAMTPPPDSSKPDAPT